MLGINKGYCSWFWDKVFGVDIGVYCYDHDAAYEAKNFKIKLKADVALAKDLWKASSQTDKPLDKLGLKATSIGAYVLTSTVGIGFWIKSYIED